MLLTLKPFVQNGVKSLYEYSAIRPSMPTPQSSPRQGPPDRSSTIASATPSQPSSDSSVSSSDKPCPQTPSMILPPLDAGRPTSATTAPGSQLPPPPLQWQNADETMRLWLQAKSEEDRRRQEEEKTRQESLRLERRKIECSMLQRSLEAGVPLHIIPLIFTETCGGPNGNNSLLQLIPEFSPASGRAPNRAPSFSIPRSRQDSWPNTSPPSYATPPPLTQQQQQLPPLRSHRASELAPPVPIEPFGCFSSGDPTNPSTHNPSRSEIVGVPGQDMPMNSDTAQHPLRSSLPLPQPQSVSMKSEIKTPKISPAIHFQHWVPPDRVPSNGRQRKEASSHFHSRRTSLGQKRKSEEPHQPVPPPSSFS
ncbi:hypothetical protein MPDQ_000476 [Monascus purpureus]|uniref:Uncharacterized protein n=1 Tax=Monascus purpureus TaxID=5098 RepID=A0A507QPK4_MONPU|nr:hypothetical protein MPDQ_000476 [Monascus purpureus]BDD57104.1 hypothetical protein MAP00_002498 [Monascus purpureus]